MGTLIRFNRTLPLFERSVESIINDGFFNSFDTNMHDLGDHYALQVAVPGMSEEHLTIQLSGNVLRIQGEKQSENRNATRQFSEFSSTRFSRSFILPEDTDHEAISAECTNGMLTIQLGKSMNGQKTTHIIINEGKEWKTGWRQKIKSLFSKKK
ncbi:MAG: Hsp20/alpha crystallin family protein [Flavobacteriales bacterium]|nr:Hsp20/alpha crystallin family protein [Flavobacteriales bacterium]